MPPRPAPATDGLTRRQVLKRGAALGAASLWTTPVLQLVRMSSARAAETSGSTCITHCIKLDVANGSWHRLGEDTDIGDATHNCLVCPSGAIDALPDSGLLDDFTFPLNVDGGFTIRYPNTWSLLVLDSSPDDLTGTATAAARCGPGNAAFSCSYAGPGNESPDPDAADTHTLLVIPPCDFANNKPITQVELIIQHCDPAVA